METISKTIEMRCIIKFLVKQNKSAVQIYNELYSVYKEQCLSRENVYYWYREFKMFGRESVLDAPGRGRPATVHTDENIQAISSVYMARLGQHE